MTDELDAYQTKRKEEVSEDYSIGLFDFSKPIGPTTVYLDYKRETNWINDSQVSSIEHLEIFSGTVRLLKLVWVKGKGLPESGYSYSDFIKEKPFPKPNDTKTLERRLKAEKLPKHVKSLLRLLQK